MYLDLDKPVEFKFSAYKRFAKNELHVTRVSREDILILMLGGTLHFTENGEEKSLSGGEYYVQRKGLLQSAVRPSSDAYYIYFHFFGSWCEGGIHGLPRRGAFDIEKIHRNADRLCQASRSRSLPFVSTTKAFCEILELLLGDNRKLDDALLLAEKIQAYLSENYTRKISVAETAEIFSYSPDYIIRVFKRAYGVTPHSYLTSCRIEHAKLLISTTNRPIGEIAEACGYTDFTTFYRSFCALAGRSPAKWRSGEPQS